MYFNFNDLKITIDGAHGPVTLSVTSLLRVDAAVHNRFRVGKNPRKKLNERTVLVREADQHDSHECEAQQPEITAADEPEFQQGHRPSLAIDPLLGQ